ncbi:MAG: hypothetical protein M3044_22845, partial [Thermoproteota archaeon]|nr:hypothetical protein [Thermoproteota archaeon]
PEVSFACIYKYIVISRFDETNSQKKTMTSDVARILIVTHTYCNRLTFDKREFVWSSNGEWQCRQPSER